jgi:hypothetical protein
MNVILLNINFNNLDIGIKFWNVCEHLTPLSRDPDEVIFGFINRVGTLSKFHARDIITLPFVWIATTSPDMSLEFYAAE